MTQSGSLLQHLCKSLGRQCLIPLVNVRKSRIRKDPETDFDEVAQVDLAIRIGGDREERFGSGFGKRSTSVTKVVA